MVFYTLEARIGRGISNPISLPSNASTCNDVVDDGSQTMGQAQQKGMYYRKGGQGRRNMTLWGQEIGGKYRNRLTLAIYCAVILESLAMEVVIRGDPEKGYNI